jgi:hypothetical protein
MEENNDKIDNISEGNNREYYSNAPGTGVLASMIFMIVTMVAMYIISKLIGN